MRFTFSLMAMELFTFEFAFPSRGIYSVPDYIPAESEDLEF